MARQITSENFGDELAKYPETLGEILDIRTLIARKVDDALCMKDPTAGIMQLMGLTQRMDRMEKKLDDLLLVLATGRPLEISVKQEEGAKVVYIEVGGE